MISKNRAAGPRQPEGLAWEPLEIYVSCFSVSITQGISFGLSSSGAATRHYWVALRYSVAVLSGSDSFGLLAALLMFEPGPNNLPFRAALSGVNVGTANISRLGEDVQALASRPFTLPLHGFVHSTVLDS